MTRLLNISQDEFIRTTEPRHARAVQALWQELERRGEIYLGRFAGWYAVRDEAFYDESELVDGQTGADRRRGRMGGGGELLLPAVGVAGPAAGVLRSQSRSIAPRSRRNEVISFVRGGLKDLSISRTSFTWGVPVPGQPGMSCMSGSTR